MIHSEVKITSMDLEFNEEYYIRVMLIDEELQVELKILYIPGHSTEFRIFLAFNSITYGS